MECALPFLKHFLIAPITLFQAFRMDRTVLIQIIMHPVNPKRRFHQIPGIRPCVRHTRSLKRAPPSSNSSLQVRSVLPFSSLIDSSPLSYRVLFMTLPAAFPSLGNSPSGILSSQKLPRSPRIATSIIESSGLLRRQTLHPHTRTAHQIHKLRIAPSSALQYLI